MRDVTNAVCLFGCFCLQTFDWWKLTIDALLKQHKAKSGNDRCRNQSNVSRVTRWFRI